MTDLKGTKTEENLKAALAGESQARVKYEFYASQAKKDGYVEIKEIFQESSDNEKEHAKIWFKLLNGGKVPDTETPKPLAKKALMTLQTCSTQQALPKRHTKTGTMHYPTRSKRAKCLQKMKKSHGNATTVDTSIMERTHLKSVRYAITHRHTSENRILATSRSFFSIFSFF